MRKFLLLILFIIIIFGALRLLLVKTPPAAPKPQTTTTPKTFVVNLEIDYGNDQKERFENVKMEEGATALGVLEKAARDNNFELKIKESSLGPFIEKIKNLSGDENHFWAFLVNGKMSEVGAGAYLIQNGDKIEFIYTKM